ncbi:MAG TPA: nitrite reductase small subunit NirD [Bryobacteraceae bacterium]|nr:nitrite reductase small subunit NirD [Bryobacteraceae bacterium]
MRWVRVTETKNIPLREGRAVQIGSEEVAIFNLGDRYLAVSNSCPHRGGPLADGIVSGSTVICPLHAWKVCLDSGDVEKPEVCVKVDTYPVSVEDGVLLVQISDEEEIAA